MFSQEMRQLRAGDAFTLAPTDPRVWVKCRGGFRPGTGGQLHACAPHVAVYPVTPAGQPVRSAEHLRAVRQGVAA